ncbi:MAG: hypothetical protein ACOY5C_08075 [Pseudomonadota bacterium]|uniref:hypothetical protein n=1 Tax=Thermithiobacillus tepidarius TaxID=929 RepID=UPI0004054716|nr:hypothetical protein [Thermithiobacillus tepidarius]
MHKILLTASLLFMSAAAAGPALAHSGSPWVDQREAMQQHRIQQGMHSGALTPREGRALYREQARIRHLEHNFLADGRLTRRERLALDRHLDRSNRHIYWQKHDLQRR